MHRVQERIKAELAAGQLAKVVSVGNETLWFVKKDLVLQSFPNNINILSVFHIYMFVCPSSIYLFVYCLFILRERVFTETIQALGINFQILF